MISACATNTTVDPELLAPVRSSPRAPAACRLVTSHQECLFRYLMRPDDCGQRQFPSHSHWRRCVRYLRYGIPTWRRYSCGPVFRVCLEQYFQPLRSYVDNLPCQLLSLRIFKRQRAARTIRALLALPGILSPTPATPPRARASADILDPLPASASPTGSGPQPLPSRAVVSSARPPPWAMPTSRPLTA